MTETNLRAPKNASAASAVRESVGGSTLPLTESPPLSPAALAAASEFVPPAYSPIVLAGAVRLIECALIALVGLAIYFIYIVSREGFAWYYIGAIGGDRKSVV